MCISCYTPTALVTVGAPPGTRTLLSGLKVRSITINAYGAYIVVRRQGLEPWTHWLRASCSALLS